MRCSRHRWRPRRSADALACTAAVPERCRRPRYDPAVAKDPSSPVDPDDVIKRSFSTVRRGADPLEVQRYLLELASQLRAGREREAELASQLREAEQRATPIDQLDPSRLTALLGEETARVLDAARAAAAEIRSKAEENVARMVREARDEAQQMRNDAETVLLRRTEEAEAEVARIRASADGVREQAERDAEGIRATGTAAREQAEVEAQRIRDEAASTLGQAEVDAAARVEEGRLEGREMVAEAQRVRQRMLDDLARRRKLMRQQIEQLQAGRDRLAAAYEVVPRDARPGHRGARGGAARGEAGRGVGGVAGHRGRRCRVRGRGRRRRRSRGPRRRGRGRRARRARRGAGGDGDR